MDEIFFLERGRVYHSRSQALPLPALEGGEISRVGKRSNHR